MLIHKSYKTELDPNQAQRDLFVKSAGVARFAYNWGIARQKEHYEQTGKKISRFDLQKELDARKREEWPWMLEVSKHCPQEALINLERAFQNFFRNIKKGGKPGYPKFKGKKHGLGSFRLCKGIRIFERHIQLPRIGTVRLKEKGYLPEEGVKILSATVSERAGRWFVSVNVEMEVTDPAPVNQEVVGVDLGIKSLAVCSDGVVFENPKALKKNLRKLKRLQRAVSRKQKGSANRKKAVQKVAKLHLRIANIRKNAIHQATAAITKRYGLVAAEDLNVKGMVKNRCLSQAVSDSGFAEFRRQLAYKLNWKGGSLVLADRWLPSSKTCSFCGQVRKELKLSERIFRCPCGYSADRDLNAALNLKNVAAKATETLNALPRGEVQGFAPVLLDEVGSF